MLDWAGKRFVGQGTLRVLEVGCGEGLNLFALARRFDIRGEGYDLDPNHVAICQRLADARFPGQFRFVEADATAQLGLNDSFDVILLMDFLEHVPNPESVVAHCEPYLKRGGVMLVSVPTTRYPRVFGWAMHRRIGHLVDGYDLEDLLKLFPPRMRCIHYRYNTGIPAQVGCFLQFRVVSRLPNEGLRWLATIPLMAFRLTDWWNSPSLSCSLFAVFEKAAEDQQS